MATDWAARGERVLVGDPDAAPGLWPGCEVRGAGDNINAIGELLAIVDAEVAQRRAQRAQGVRRFPPLHLVIDEAQDVLPALEGGLELFEDVARRGGKLNIRMTVGVQDKQVRTLGLEGKSEVLRNLQIADVLKGRDGRRVAVLRDAESGKKISMEIPELTDPESLIIAPAAVSARRPVSEKEAADLLASLFPESVTSASQRPGNASGVTVTVTSDSGNGNGNTPVTSVVTPSGNTPVVNVYAQALAAGAPGQGRRRRGRGLDMRRRRQLAQAAQNRDELTSAYAQARANGVKSFRAAYGQLGGNRKDALAAWQAAEVTP